MSLRTQIGLLLTALTLVLVITTYQVQSYVILPAFEEIERESALADVNRCTAAIDRDLELLSHFCLDWSAWDDVYQFAQDRNSQFMESNLKDNAFEVGHVNLICILNPNHQIVWGGFRDMQTLEALDASQLFAILAQKQPNINQFATLESSHAGIVPTSSGPLLIAARPITTSDIEGPSPGTMMFGRLYNEQAVDGLRNRTNIDLQLWDLSAPNIPNEMAQLAQEAANTPITRIVDDNSLEAFRLVNDIFGQPLLLVQAKLQRPIMTQGRIAAQIATACTAVGGIITMCLLAGVLRWRITKPITRMANHAVQLAKQTSLKARLNLSRSDEIGVLGKEFDRMVEHLDQSRKQLSESAHQAGMAEIASEILHNIGNAINSLNCSASQLETQFANSKLSGLIRSSALLREYSHNVSDFIENDPRGPKLIQYLLDLTEALQQEKAANQHEITRLKDTTRHIAEIIAAQQSYAKRTDFRHEVDFNSLLSEVIAINQEAIRTLEVNLELNAPELPDVMLNKSKIIQVLVNLIRNALQAMQDQPSDQRILKISCQIIDELDLEIDISDSGMGFDQQTQSKLFTHGFTTKPTGNGFGLHYCANSIREMGGHISAQSAGPGLGATFRIRIPNVFSKSQVAVTDNS